MSAAPFGVAERRGSSGPVDSTVQLVGDVLAVLADDPHAAGDAAHADLRDARRSTGSVPVIVVEAMAHVGPHARCAPRLNSRDNEKPRDAVFRRRRVSS